MARCHRTVTDAIPSVVAIAETGRPSSSCITTTARRRGVNASSARHTTTLASRAVSLCVPRFDGRTPFQIVSLADGRFSPLVASEIDKSSDEPGFFARCTDRNGRWGPGGSDERVLHEIERIIRTGRQSPGQTIQAWVVLVEQGGQSAGSVVRRSEWYVGNHRHAGHFPSRRAAPGIRWAISHHPAMQRDRRCSGMMPVMVGEGRFWLDAATGRRRRERRFYAEAGSRPEHNQGDRG